MIDLNSQLKNKDKIVYVGIYDNDIIYIQFEDNTINDTKVRLINNGRNVTKRNWNYLKELEKRDYTIIITNSGGVIKEENVTSDSNLIQCFELLMLYIHNINRIVIPIFLSILPSHTRLYFNSSRIGNPFFNKSTWDENINNCKKVIGDISDAVDTLQINEKYRYHQIVSLLFFEIHKILNGIEDMSNEEIIKLLDNWCRYIKDKRDYLLSVQVGYESGNIDTNIIGEIPKDKIVNMKLKIPNIKQYLGSINNNAKIKRNLVYSVTEKTNNKILPYRIGTTSMVIDKLDTAWIVTDRELKSQAKDIINDTYKEILASR